MNASKNVMVMGSIENVWYNRAQMCLKYDACTLGNFYEGARLRHNA